MEYSTKGEKVSLAMKVLIPETDLVVERRVESIMERLSVLIAANLEPPLTRFELERWADEPIVRIALAKLIEARYVGLDELGRLASVQVFVRQD